MEDKEPVKCFKGFSSHRAWNLHHQLKRELIVDLPHEGGTIKAEVIRR